MIELRTQYVPSNSNEIWVIIDDDYNSENAAPNTTSGAILLPSPHTLVVGQDAPPMVQAELYKDDLMQPAARQFIASLIYGAVGHNKVYLCPGTSPTELFLPQLLNHLLAFYGITVGGETGAAFNFNPGFFDILVAELAAFGIPCSTMMLYHAINGNTLVSPFGERTSHASIFKAANYPF